MVEEKIKSMKLYNFIDRVYNELKELGKEIKKINLSEIIKIIKEQKVSN